MSAVITSNANGLPLFVIEEHQLNKWLQGQSGLLQNWVHQQQLSGKGCITLPNEKGELAGALCLVESLNDIWALGDAVGQLPATAFELEVDASYQVSLAIGWLLGSYVFDRYKPSTKQFPTLVLHSEDAVNRAEKIAAGVSLVRDLVNTPAADMMPQHIQACAESLATEFNGTCNSVVGDELLKQNFPTIHMVGRASKHAPRLVELNWGNEQHPKVTLVGKGVCFDSGGLDLKPAAGMRLMKKDMGGAAHVLGLARLIMSFNLPIRLQVLVPAVENAVSDDAFRPGDVVTTRKGITVEIDNTDAEGRLVLCDALAYAQEHNPELIIDFATLTGACRVALGTSLPGYFTDSESIASSISQSGTKTQDPAWRLPLHKPYNDMLNSKVADMTNCAAAPFGGAITAALYLQKFVKTQEWVHFDVMAWNLNQAPGRPVGGEAFGVRAVFDWLSTQYSN